MGKRETKVDLILKFAADNFNRKGASGVSIQDIANDANVTRAEVYYHFKDKETLETFVEVDVLYWSALSQ